MNKWKKLIMAVMGITLIMPPMTSWALSVKSASVQSKADHATLTLDFDSALPSGVSYFRVMNPPRQVIDFPVKLSSNTLPLSLTGKGRVVKAEILQAQGRSRIVFQMAESYEVSKKVSGHQIQFTVSGPSPFHPDMVSTMHLGNASKLRDVAEKTFKKDIPLIDSPVLQSWELVTKPDGSEAIKLVFDRDAVTADATLNNSGLHVKFAHAQIAKGVAETLSNATSSMADDIRLQPGDENLILHMKLKNAKEQIKQFGKVVEVSLYRPSDLAKVKGNPVIATQSPAQADQDRDYEISKYHGKPITLNFKDADIETVLQVFAEFTHTNLVLSDNVKGKVTVHLTNVPWDQALDIVLQSKNLVSSQNGNVLLVSTPTDLANNKQNEVNERAKDEMEPLVSKTFLISYQKTEDLLKVIESPKAKLLSSRATIIADERTSQIFIEDTVSRMQRIDSVIKSLDKPVKQVLIEAKIVLADTKIAKEIGSTIRVASSRATDFSTLGDQFGKGNFVNTGSDASTNFAYTLLNSNGTRLVNLQLKAFESDNLAKTVSNPKVVTSNKDTALIEQGTEIPYQVATSSGATSTEFKSATLKLEVTPQIAPDGSILMDVDVSKDSVGQTTNNGPAIDTRHVKTKVLVTDGGTVVLGGIFEDSSTDQKGKIPLLGDIPVLGNLFKSSAKNKQKTELLIFLTPVVMQDQ